MNFLFNQRLLGCRAAHGLQKVKCADILFFIFYQALQAKLVEYSLGDLLAPFQEQDVTLEVPSTSSI